MTASNHVADGGVAGEGEAVVRLSESELGVCGLRRGVGTSLPEWVWSWGRGQARFGARWGSVWGVTAVEYRVGGEASTGRGT